MTLFGPHHLTCDKSGAVCVCVCVCDMPAGYHVVHWVSSGETFQGARGAMPPGQKLRSTLLRLDAQDPGCRLLWVDTLANFPCSGLDSVDGGGTRWRRAHTCALHLRGIVHLPQCQEGVSHA